MLSLNSDSGTRTLLVAAGGDGETASIPSHPASRRNTLSVVFAGFASLCQDRRSSVDKLPPPASFFSSAASPSNTYPLTPNPCALLSDNKNNR
ncbi:Dihydrolipoyllysine-residue succinyltransferase component of 2-oxoglutarate dehydrogenase complex [Dissostichus eleginoides]|uniref:Dihydrolipoyllysine-residue succinyltransferase component of 2-oxoglutarate dehydrogenase complex n=1 Tax=Dissostichus eleginoides TaxID=100907 RepID=A0AAD9F362_DISEL|nr:Dihydrolipoyllysine-residue succinyltransferase component of 2-oxoglutarate dehydrogenase complex [Dissostichus eleginoides]